MPLGQAASPLPSRLTETSEFECGRRIVRLQARPRKQLRQSAAAMSIQAGFSLLFSVLFSV